MNLKELSKKSFSGRAFLDLYRPGLHGEDLLFDEEEGNLAFSEFPDINIPGVKKFIYKDRGGFFRRLSIS